MLHGWENGTRNVSEKYRGLLCVALDATPGELGFLSQPPPASDVFSLVMVETSVAIPSYPTSFEESLTLLAQLTDSNSEISTDSFSAVAIPSLALDWMTMRDREDRQVSGGRVTESDVKEVRSTTRMLDSLDRQLGGGTTRVLAAKYLHDVVLPKLRGNGADSVMRDLFRAAAVLSELTAWLSYDSALHGLAQRFFVQALRLASAAGDRSYGAYVLSSMSDQALFLGHPDQALRLALASSSEGSASPGVRSEALLLEARAHAAMRDRSSCSTALLAAEAVGKKSDGDSDLSIPIDELIIAGHAGSCWLDLGDKVAAERSLAESLRNSAGQARREIYYLVHLAKVALLNKDIEQASSLGERAASLLREGTSHRSAHHLHALMTQVHALNHHSAADFIDLARLALKPFQNRMPSP